MVQVGPNSYQIISDCDFLILGFPTYHGKPSTSMLEFVANMPRVISVSRTVVNEDAEQQWRHSSGNSVGIDIFGSKHLA